MNRQQLDKEVIQGNEIPGQITDMSRAVKKLFACVLNDFMLKNSQ